MFIRSLETFQNQGREKKRRPKANQKERSQAQLKQSLSTSWGRSWAHPGESFSQPEGIPLENFSSFKKLSPLSPKPLETF